VFFRGRQSAAGSCNTDAQGWSDKNNMYIYIYIYIYMWEAQLGTIWLGPKTIRYHMTPAPYGT